MMNIPMNRWRAPVLVGMVLAALATPGYGVTEMVVIEARGTDLKPGQVVDGEQSVELAAGAEVVLIGADGTPVSLQGPFSGPVRQPGDGAEPADRSVVEALSGLLVAETERDLGATRAVEGASAAVLPDPWVVAVEHSGDHCLREEGPTVLWRLDDSQRLPILFTPEDGAGQKAKAVWPANFQRLLVPSDRVHFNDGGRYAVRLGAQHREITFHVMPVDVRTLGKQAAWMARRGCKRQALTLIRQATAQP